MIRKKAQTEQSPCPIEPQITKSKETATWRHKVGNTTEISVSIAEGDDSGNIIVRGSLNYGSVWGAKEDDFRCLAAQLNAAADKLSEWRT